MEDIITHRDKINIKTEEEISKDALEKRKLAHKEVLEDNLNKVKTLILSCAVYGNKFAIHRHFGDTYEGMFEDIIPILEEKGYKATKHKIFMGEEVLAITIGLPFSESEEKIKEYIKRQGKNNMEISLLMLLVVAVLIGGLFCLTKG